MAAKPLDWLTK